jgi:hypothetical protein
MLPLVCPPKQQQQQQQQQNVAFVTPNNNINSTQHKAAPMTCPKFAAYIASLYSSCFVPLLPTGLIIVVSLYSHSLYYWLL